MTSKDKAVELANKFKGSTDVIFPNQASIKYAKICVQEIIEAINNDCMLCKQSKRDYWQEVLNHLNEM